MLISLIMSCSNSNEEGTQLEADEATYFLPDGVRCIELIAQDVDTSRYYFREFVAGSGLIVSGDSYLALDDTIPCFYHFPFERHFDDIAWLNGNCFLARDSTIYYAEDDGEEHAILRTDNRVNRIWPIESGIYFSSDSTISFFRFEIADAEPVAKMPGIISDVAPMDSEDCFVACDSTIIFISNGELYKVVSDSLPILSVALHPNESLFFSTKHRVAYLDVDGVQTTIVNKGARQLLLVSDNLFCIHDDNSSIILNGIRNFNKMIEDEKRNEQNDTVVG